MHEILLTYDEIKDSRQGSSSHFLQDKREMQKGNFIKMKGEKMKKGVLHMANRGTDSIIS